MKTTNFRVINGTLLFFAGILCTFFMGVTQAQASWTSGGPYAGYVTSLAMAGTNPDIIYAGKRGGVQKTTDGGETWTLTWTYEYGLNVIEVNPSSPLIVYAGTNNDGIYKSEDSGNEWFQQNGQSNELNEQKVKTIATDPHNPLILFVGTIWNGQIDFFGALFKSTDGGETWQEKMVAGDWREGVMALLVDTDNFSYIYAGLRSGPSSDINFLRSTDGGENWEWKTIGPDFQNDVVALAMTPVGSSSPAIYAIVQNDNVYKSTDGGESWTSTNAPFISEEGPWTLAVDPNNSDVIYAGTHKNDGEIYKSTDGGKTWYIKANGLPDGGGPSSIAIDQRNSDVYVGFYEGGVYKSSDGGESWHPKGLRYGAYIKGLAVEPTSSGTAFTVVDDGHLAKTTDSGASWSYLLDSPSDLGAVAIDPQNPSTIWAGDGKKAWGSTYNPNDPYNELPGSLSFYIYKSEDGGQNWQTKYLTYLTCQTQCQTGVSDILIKADDSDVILVSMECFFNMEGELLRTTNGGVTWQTVDAGSFTTLAADPTNPEIIYYGTARWGSVKRSINGGISWSTINPSTPWVWTVNDIEVGLNSRVYVATGEGLWMYNKYEWTKLPGLPTDDIRALAIDRSTWPEVVYAGTSGHGVFVSIDSGNSWIPFNEGSGNLSITKLAMSRGQPKMLYAGTASRVWSTPIPDYPPTVLWHQPIRPAGFFTMLCQDFTEPYDDYDIFIADDFSTTETWNIQTVFVPGNLLNPGTTLMNATTLHFQIYTDDQGTPDGDPYGGGNSPIWNLSVLPTDPQISISDGIKGLPSNVTLSLDTPIKLQPGTYWFSFYPELDYTTAGTYGKLTATTKNGNPAQVINPGGGYGFPTGWTSVTDESTLNMAEQDIAFLLAGSIADCQGDLDGDCDVDGSDLAVFAADFGRTDCDTGEECEGDFDRNNDVDHSDLAVFAADFGRTDFPE